MASFRRFSALDLFHLNAINLDEFTENYQLGFYLRYLMRWPQYCIIVRGLDDRPVGYVFGKSEGYGPEWHGHVTALSVASSHQRLGLAHQLLERLEETSRREQCNFVDLFVRPSNEGARRLYGARGYVIYRQVLEYYTGGQPEDALDLRKSLTDRPIQPLPNPVRAEDLDY